MNIIAITGPPAVGTTTLLEGIIKEKDWKGFYSENYFQKSPYYQKFLKDHKKWAFHNQIFFVGEYVKGYKKVTNKREKIVCLDYFFSELVIYTEAMRKVKFITKSEYNILKNIIHSYNSFLPKPDLIIFIQASFLTLLDRINQRGRGNEKCFKTQYLKKLRTEFTNYFLKREESIIKLNSDKQDFRKEKEVIKIIKKIKSNLVEK